MNHWLPLVLGPELAIERTPLVLCFKSSLISSWCQDLCHITGLLQNKGAPEISLPKCSHPLFQYLLGLQFVPWSPGKSKNVSITYSCLCINSLSSSPWCFVWTCNCCSSLFHTRPGNFHKSDEIYFRFIKIQGILQKFLQATPNNHHQPLGTLGHCSQKSSILMSPTLVWTVTDMLSLSETAAGHNGQPIRMKIVSWLQNTTQN